MSLQNILKCNIVHSCHKKICNFLPVMYKFLSHMHFLCIRETFHFLWYDKYAILLKLRKIVLHINRNSYNYVSTAFNVPFQ